MQTPAPVDYAKATSVAHAIELLQQLGEDSRPLAGGHSLLPMMKLRLAAPEALVDLNDIPELQGVRVEGDHIVVGSMTKHRDILDSAILAEHYPIFREAEQVIADPIVRNRGTIGGSACQADPAADLSAVGSALRGTAVVQGPNGTREVSLREFHDGPYVTVLEPDEILVALKYPIRPGAGSAGAWPPPASSSWCATAWSSTAASATPPWAPSTTAPPVPRPPSSASPPPRRASPPRRRSPARSATRRPTSAARSTTSAT